MKYAVITLALFGAIIAAPVDDEAVREFERGNRMLSAAIYKELIKQSAGNLVVSPFSLETILSLTYEGARGQTAAELVKGLYLPDTDMKVQAAYKSILPKIQSSASDLNLISANRIYLRENAVLEERFRSIATSVYRSGVENVDFSQSAVVANEINTWVEEQTNNKIRNLVDASTLSASTVILLVNTLYLSGKWATPFSPTQTQTDFYRTGGDSVRVNSMFLQEYLNYWENEELDAQFLELPLEGANISMVIALPREVDGFALLEENVEQALEPQQYIRQLVDVQIPKFSVESKIQFLPILENLGIRRVFSQEADLSGISSTDQNLSITSVIQKTYINVTEYGVEAASATDVSGLKSPGVPPMPVVFRANRPFLYYIKNNGIVLFSGRFVNPEEQ